MLLKKITIKDFRNISNIEIYPDEKINVIYGDNGEGKTNLIESIWLLTGNQSFRGNKINEMIMIDKNTSLIEAFFEDKERENNLKINLSQRKSIKLNNIELNSFNELQGNFFSVVFSPTHLSLIKDGPKQRRKFLDNALCEINIRYKNHLNTYEKLLEQRNALLKNANQYYNIKENIDIWDRQITKVGTVITAYRNEYTKKLNNEAVFYYNQMSSQKENFNVKYVSTVFENNIDIQEYKDEYVEIYYKKLKENFSEDIKQGFTTVGPHRDDLDISVKDLSARIYGSQGQQRSSVIALKLAEAKLLKNVVKENPVMLLDDVLSELDIKRQEYILNNLEDMQVFITCCDNENTKILKKGKVFHIEKGNLKEEHNFN